MQEGPQSNMKRGPRHLNVLQGVQQGEGLQVGGCKHCHVQEGGLILHVGCSTLVQPRLLFHLHVGLCFRFRSSLFRSPSRRFCARCDCWLLERHPRGEDPLGSPCLAPSQELRHRNCCSRIPLVTPTDISEKMYQRHLCVASEEPGRECGC